MPDTRIFHGGCACGRLTFEAKGEPKRVGLCHCLTCRKIGGSVFSAFAIFPADRVTISGEFRRWTEAGKSSGHCFCPHCGSQVFDSDAEGEIEIKLGAFDAPNLFRPTYEGWAKRRETWLGTPDLVSYPEDRGEITE